MVGRHPRRDGPLLLLRVAVMGMARPHLAAPPVVVGLLSGHDPKQWHNATCGAEGSARFVACNLRVYEAAVETAAAQGVQLLVFPEAHALSGDLDDGEYAYWETVTELALGCVRGV